jgi:hypothetical protein
MNTTPLQMAIGRELKGYGMSREIVPSLILLICVSSANSATADERWTPQQPVGSATIALTAFDVNDTSLQLRYKIANSSNHDVWVCDAIFSPYKTLPTDYEVFVDEDAKTLVIRRQIEVPAGESPVPRRYDGRCVLLRPGEERAGAFSMSTPVVRHTMVGPGGSDANVATRIAVKIGAYDEDLPGKIRRLLDLAERLGYSPDLFSSVGGDEVLFSQYFRGFSISSLLGGSSGFSNLWTEGSAQIDIPFIGLSFPFLGDESVLQIAVDGVTIPMAY